MSDDVTRFGIVKFQVDSDDPTKCGRNCFIQWNGGFPTYCSQYGHFKDDEECEQKPPNRLPACLAAEIVVDEIAESTAQEILDNDEDWGTDYISLAYAYRALVEKLE